MPFWNRRPATKNDNQVERSYIEQTANQAIHDLAAGEDPRGSIAVEMALKWLWQPDEAKIRALHRVCGCGALQPEHYGRFLSDLIPSDEDEPPLQPYPVVAARLHDLLAGLLFVERTPLCERENLRQDLGILTNGVAMVDRLKMVEAHGVICRLLSAARFQLQKRSWGALGTPPVIMNSEAGARLLIQMTTDCLLAFPPDAIPEFWSKLRTLNTARDLSPVAARMRDRRAVPYLLEALPFLDDDGQSDVISALGKIRDTRAVPALQALAADKTKLVAVVAANALATILGSSHDDAAQLLRATDSRHGGNAAETLLRAAAPTPTMTTPADQLLRADMSAHDEARDITKDR